MSTTPSDPRIEYANRRTHMASFRTQLALDRTTLAWVRTSLTMAGFGFGTVGFFRSLREASPTPENVRLHQGAIMFGVGLVVLGLVATVLAGIAHWLELRRLRKGELPTLRQWPLSITVAALATLLGVAGMWALI